MITAPIAPAGDAGSLVERIAAAARAGVHLIQIRQPDFDALSLVSIVERARRAVVGTAARILVNDRLDVALAAGADGVHLRGDSLAAARARRVSPPGFLIGRSVHSADQARAAERGGGLDYLLFGTVFPTASKPGAAAAGLDALSQACAAVALPVLAIGGMTASVLAPVARGGAAGFAAIGLFAAGEPGAIAEAVGQAVSAFDTPEGLP
jgi:thiamine-phosphate pyrophosphorylase